MEHVDGARNISLRKPYFKWYGGNWLGSILRNKNRKKTLSLTRLSTALTGSLRKLTLSMTGPLRKLTLSKSKRILQQAQARLYVAVGYNSFAFWMPLEDQIR